jgi:hypothetical protein
MQRVDMLEKNLSNFESFAKYGIGSKGIYFPMSAGPILIEQKYVDLYNKKMKKFLVTFKCLLFYF